MRTSLVNSKIIVIVSEAAPMGETGDDVRIIQSLDGGECEKDSFALHPIFPINNTIFSCKSNPKTY